jgi:hypothetical protein
VRAPSFIGGKQKAKYPMSNELVKSEKNLPAQYDSNVEELAAEAANDLGTLLKFAKGIWSLGDDKAPVGAEFIACPEAVVIGWVRFDNQRVAERILKRPGDKRRLPDRDELSVPDKADWPLDGKHQPKDPWVRQHYLPLIDTDGALVTFVSGSVGGKLAIGKLCSAYLKNRARPIVKLDVGSFRSKEYGAIPAPDFSIIGFEGVDVPDEKNPDASDGGVPFNDSISF